MFSDAPHLFKCVMSQSIQQFRIIPNLQRQGSYGNHFPVLPPINTATSGLGLDVGGGEYDTGKSLEENFVDSMLSASLMHSPHYMGSSHQVRVPGSSGLAP